MSYTQDDEPTSTEKSPEEKDNIISGDQINKGISADVAARFVAWHFVTFADMFSALQS